MIKLKQFIPEEKQIGSPIDMKKLKAYAAAIAVLCNGEYGDVYFNESTNHIFVNLGDSNPFDFEQLEWYMRDAIKTNWEVKDDLIKIEVENEIGCPDGYKKI